jgi:capsule polysaccharide modification protein KpsS
MPRVELDVPVSVGHSFAWAGVYAMAYYIASSISTKYPHYQHHRPLSVWREGRKWVLSGLRKLWFSFADRAIMGRLTNELADLVQTCAGYAGHQFHR